jgi:hypothetical protein
VYQPIQPPRPALIVAVARVNEDPEGLSAVGAFKAAAKFSAPVGGTCHQHYTRAVELFQSIHDLQFTIHRFSEAGHALGKLVIAV